MGQPKPFHRVYRPVREQLPNAGYSSWAYIIDPDYAKYPDHYVRALNIIQDDLRNIFEYIEPSPHCSGAYSYRTHALLMRTCIEIEANFKAILQENIFTVSPETRLNIGHFRKVDESHHLSSFKIMLPIWNDSPLVLQPFDTWLQYRGIPMPPGVSPAPTWYKAYNESKHDRQTEFKQANLKNLIDAVAALVILVSAQFRGEEFGAGGRVIAASGLDYHPMEPAIGNLFRIEYPTDWPDNDIYEFNWIDLKNRSAPSEKFDKFDYDAVPI